MDKKAKKKLEVLRKRLQQTQTQLKGAREQMDDPTEVETLEKTIADLQQQIDAIKQG